MSYFKHIKKLMAETMTNKVEETYKISQLSEWWFDNPLMSSLWLQKIYEKSASYWYAK